MTERFCTDLITRLNDMVAHAVDTLSEPQEVGYAVSMTVVPDQAPGKFVPVSAVVLTIPAANPDDTIYVTNMSANLKLSQSAVVDMVKVSLENMRTQRTEDLAQANGHGGPGAAGG